MPAKVANAAMIPIRAASSGADITRSSFTGPMHRHSLSQPRSGRIDLDQ
jgi:hypothetical protein